MGSLVWFRSDLRVSDHLALDAARQSEGPLKALFVVTPEQWQRHDWGEPKIDFVTRSVEALAQALGRRGIELLVESCPTFREVPATVLRVAEETESRTVFVHRELEVNERRRDDAVRERLEASSIALVEHDDQTIVPLGALRTTSGGPYTVFTPFFRAWVRHLEDRGLSEPLPAPPTQAPREVAAPGLPSASCSAAIRELWPAGEDEAERRLETFLATAASRYDEDRDDPNRSATSTLSPYLAAGVISIRSVLWKGLEANGGELVGKDAGTSAWLRQLAWRDFYRHVLDAFPRVSMHRPFRPGADLVWRDDPVALEAWKQGRTGFPIVDAAMRALAETGWMHNRLRMIVASFLTKDLLIDWRAGERHFMQSLVDADLANNNGGWQWAASTGTDAAPYFRILNPWRQSERFDPEGRFIRRFLPELAEVPARSLHSPSRLGAAIGQLDYPSPIVDHQEARQRTLSAFRAA